MAVAVAPVGGDRNHRRVKHFCLCKALIKAGVVEWSQELEGLSQMIVCGI